MPVVGHRFIEATDRRVVLPEPLRPSTTQRSPGATAQSIGPRIVRPARRTDTPVSSMITLRMLRAGQAHPRPIYGAAVASGGGSSVGSSVGSGVGSSVGSGVGSSVGVSVGSAVGSSLGGTSTDSDGSSDGLGDGHGSAATSFSPVGDGIANDGMMPLASGDGMT